MLSIAFRVPHASPHRRPRFLPLSLTLHSVVAHAPPPVTTFTVALAFPHCRLRSHPSSLTLPPTFSHASPLISHASSHRRPLPPTVDLPSLPPLSTSLSPTLGGEVWRAGLGAGKGVVTRSLWGVEGCVVSSTHPFLSCTDLLSSLAPTPHAWQVVMRLWSRVLGAQLGQRAQAGSKECSAAGGGLGERGRRG
ncbi:unnamed protein product [Closterium sp. NIES-64]|nr:unnamed protein product [Closterium sp. NIES-64]